MYNKHIIERILSRGDGIDGRDITHIKDYIDIPHKIKDAGRMKSWVGVSGKKTVGTKAIVKGIVKELTSLEVVANK